MCGIAGLIYRGNTGAIGQEMTAMLEALKHRGPDSTGFALYGVPHGDDLIMRLKLAEQAEMRKGFDIHRKIPERRKIVDARITELGERSWNRRRPPSTPTGTASALPAIVVVSPTTSRMSRERRYCRWAPRWSW